MAEELHEGLLVEELAPAADTVAGPEGANLLLLISLINDELTEDCPELLEGDPRLALSNVFELIDDQIKLLPQEAVHVETASALTFSHALVQALL
jgi:hypothetical protein